jgi:hypothetical protein
MPSAERPVVVDATPIVALAGLGHLDLLQRLHGEVDAAAVQLDAAVV